MGFSFHVIRALLSFKLWSFSPKNFSSCDYWKNEPWIHQSRSLLTLQWTPPFIKNWVKSILSITGERQHRKKIGDCINAKVRTEICGTHWALFIPFHVPNGTVNYTFRLHRPDPSHRAFGYFSCKQDKNEMSQRQTGQRRTLICVDLN